MKDERGQAIVLVVFAIIGLAAVIGLALDGGRLYQTRREVQNAADAMAMAGTRVLASDGCTPGINLEAEVCQAIVDYGAEYGVVHDGVTGRIEAWYVNKDATRLGGACVGLGVPNGTTGVEVTAQVTETTTFMRVVGQETIAPVGDATAMFGPVVQSGGGILPIGFPVQRVDSI
nr:Tad domain-containing protein [Anaerolineae bacterium]